MKMKTKLSDMLQATESSEYRELIQRLIRDVGFEDIKNFAMMEASDTKEGLSEKTVAGIEFVTGVLAQVTIEPDAAKKIFGMTCTQVWNFMAKIASEKIDILKDPENPEAKTVVERIFWRHTLQWAMAASVNDETCRKIGITNPDSGTND